MGSWGLPRVPRIPENSKGFKVLKFPKDPKLSKIFGSPRISKVSLDLRSSQGSKLLIFIMLSKIHRSFNFVMYTKRNSRNRSSKVSSRNSRKELKNTFDFLKCHRIFMFLDHRKNIQISSSTSLCIPYSNYAILPDPNNIQRNQQFYCWSDLKWFAKGTCIHTNSFKQ